MVDLDSVLLSVQERDKWRRRLELLERSLSDVRERRRRLELRLRRIKKDLVRLTNTTAAHVPPPRIAPTLELNSAPRHLYR